MSLALMAPGRFGHRSGPDRCSGLPVLRCAPDQLAEEFPDWLVVRTEREEHRTPGRVMQPFTWLLLRGTAESGDRRSTSLGT